MSRRIRPAIALLAVVTSSSVRAEPSEEAKRLMKLRDSERYQVETEHGRAGAARIHVRSPVAKVRKVVSDFRNYSKFIPNFSKAKVVGRDGDKTDVYLQVPILEGAAKLWAVVRFEPIKTEDGEERLEGHALKGNVRRLDAKWRLMKIDDENTQLNLELLIVPKLPAPGSLVAKQAAYAADRAVTGSRNRAEKKESKRKK